MVRTIAIGCLGMVLAASGGCVAAIGNRVAIPDFAARRPVVIDGRIYVVDVRTGTVMKLPKDAIDDAGPFHAGHDDDDD